MGLKFKDLRGVVVDNLDAGIATELKSAPGRGKSDFVESLVKYLSDRDGFQWGFTTLFLATYTPQDLMGYMVPAKKPDGSIISQFTTPPWMITSEGKHINEYQRGIVFLDEYGQGDGDTKRVSAQLLLKGEVGPHKLGPGIGVIAASNRASDRSGVTKDFDFVINRRMEVAIQDDLESWQEWAEDHGVMPITRAFAQQNPTIVFSDGVPDKQGPWCTPRSLAMADKLLNVKAQRSGGQVPIDPVTVETLEGLIGMGAAQQYMIFVRLDREMPPYEEIVKGPAKAKVPTKPDAQMLIAYNLAHRVKVEDADPVIEYIERMPKEFSVTFATSACKRQPGIVRTPAFQQWVKRNSSLMASIATINSAR
jgi:hypothetical protein